MEKAAHPCRIYQARAVNAHCSNCGYLAKDHARHVDVKVGPLEPGPADLSGRLMVDPVTRWPFRETPGEFAKRLLLALQDVHVIWPGEAHVLSAVRAVLIEEPPALAAWLDPGAAAQDSADYNLLKIALRHAFPDLQDDEPITTERVLALGKKFNKAVIAASKASEPDLGSFPKGFPRSPYDKAEPRDFIRDLDYLASADAYADEGQLGEAAARSILAIAINFGTRVQELRGMIEDDAKKLEDLGVALAHAESMMGPTDEQRDAVADACDLLDMLNQSTIGSAYNVISVLAAATATELLRVFALPEKVQAQKERKIITSFVHPPIPWRHNDWFAYFDGDEPDDEGTMLHGHGETEAEAIAELKRAAEDGDIDIYEAPPAPKPEHAPNCSTRCRKQAEHKHPCDCGAEVKS